MKPGPARNALAAAMLGFTLLTAAVALMDGLSIPSPPRSVMRYENREVHVVAVAPQDLISRAGLKSGDTIVAFNGRPFEHRLDMAEWFRALKPGDEAVFRVRRDGVEQDFAIRTWVNLHPRDALRLGIPLCVILLVGAGVYFTRPQLPGVGLFLFSACAAAIFVGCSATGLAGTSPSSRLISFSYMVLSTPGPAAGMHFFLRFPHHGPLQKKLMWTLPFLYSIQIGLGLQYWLPGVWEGFTSVTAGPRLVGFWLLGYVVSQFFCGILAGVSLLSTALKPGPARLRRQAWVVIAGGILAHILYLGRFEHIRRAVGLPEYDFFILALLATVMPLFVAAAIVFHRMFDINVLTQQRLVYGAASAGVALLFISLMGGAGFWLGKSTGTWPPPSGARVVSAAARCTRRTSRASRGEFRGGLAASTCCGSACVVRRRGVASA